MGFKDNKLDSTLSSPLPIIPSSPLATHRDLPKSTTFATPAWRAGSLLKQMASAKFADLHVHTRISDGFFTAEDAVEQAHRAGLAALAIADHDSIDGIQAAIWAGKKYGVEIIPAVELSSGIDNHELHIVGYYIDWQNKWFRDKLRVFQDARRDRARKIVERLGELGMDVPYNLVIALEGGVVGRPHIAQAMVIRGYVETTDEAFDKYLGAGKPACVAKYPLSPAGAIKLIKKAGGLPVLVHPVFAHVDDMLPKLVEDGLGGIEVYHSKHDAKVTKHYTRLARKYGLLITGGSDSHGGGDVLIGSVRVPYSIVERIKDELAAARKIRKRVMVRVR